MQEDQARILRTGNREHSSDESSVSVAGGAWAGEPGPMCFPDPQTDRRRMSQFGRKTKGIFIRKMSESQCSYAVALFLNEQEVFLKSDLISPCHFQTVPLHWEMLEGERTSQASAHSWKKDSFISRHHPPPLFSTKGISDDHSSWTTGTSSRPCFSTGFQQPTAKKRQSRNRILPPWAEIF